MPQTPDDVGVNITAEQGQSSEKASANTELANLFTAAMAPFVGQMTKLIENVSLLLSSRDPESEEDGETAFVEAVEDSDHERVDMEASLSDILESKTTEKAAPRTSDAFLQELAQNPLVKEQTSPSIHEGLAGIFNGLLSEKMADDKIKAKLDKYTGPENIKGLRTSKVNPLIWNQLSATMKAQDARFQKGQNVLIGSVIAMTKAADLVLAKYSQDRDLITLLTDAITMALQFNHEVNHSRRVAMKKELHKDYAALCNSSTVEGSSELLFGDLSKLAKDISEANKLTKKVRPPHSTNSRGDKYGGRSSYGSSQGNRRFHPYSKGKPYDFLGKRRFSKQRKKKDGETSQRQ